MNSTLRNLVVASLVLSAAASTHAAVWSTSAQYGSYTSGAFNYNNNLWGAGHGPQTIWVNSQSDWGVWANHPNTGGIKSYPRISYNIGKNISQLSRLTTSVSATTPAGGAWASTFDIWDVNYQYEIMLWTNYTGTSNGCGNVKPISYNWNASGCAIPVYTNVNVGGSTWNIYRGSNGANQVFSFLRTTKTNNANIDVLAILNYLRARGWMGDVRMGELQYGFEITSSSGGMNFHSRNFTVTSY